MPKNKIVSDSGKKFSGDQKVGRWILSSWERRFVDNYVRFVPSWLETYHLTMMTIVWSLTVVFSGYFAQRNISWLWLASGMIFAQYITDLFDGSVGRLRNTGLVKWGYFMDHFLDYVFFCSILFSYAFLLPAELAGIGLLFAMVSIGIMVNFYLLFAATNQFRISYIGIGPTEIRLFLIIFNTLLIKFGPGRVFQGLPYMTIFFAVILVLVVFQSHKETWEIDMKNKN